MKKRIGNLKDKILVQGGENPVNELKPNELLVNESDKGIDLINDKGESVVKVQDPMEPFLEVLSNMGFGTFGASIRIMYFSDVYPGLDNINASDIPNVFHLLIYRGATGVRLRLHAGEYYDIETPSGSLALFVLFKTTAERYNIGGPVYARYVDPNYIFYSLVSPDPIILKMKELGLTLTDFIN